MKLIESIKPIFHCDAKLLASGLGVGGNAKIYQHVGIFWRYPRLNNLNIR